MSPRSIRLSQLALFLSSCATRAPSPHTGPVTTAIEPHGPVSTSRDAGESSASPAPVIAIPARPRAVAPITASRVTSARPTLRWIPAPDSLATEIEMCPLPSCPQGRLLWQSASGTTQPEAALAPGDWSWRLRAVRADGSRNEPSPWWSLRVGHGNAGVNTAWGLYVPPTRSRQMLDSSGTRIDYPPEGDRAVGDVDGDGVMDLADHFHAASDLDGDGYADRVTQPDATSPCQVLWGGPLGLRGTELTTLTWSGTAWHCDEHAHAGDVDGDGLSDLILRNDDTLAWVPGHADRVFAAPTLLPLPPSTTDDVVIEVAAAGDWNGDGYADLVVTLDTANGSMRPRSLRLVSWAGSPTGFQPQPRVQDLRVRHMNGDVALSITGDLNADGYSDLVLALEQEAQVLVFDGRPAGWRNTRSSAIHGRSFDHGVSGFGAWPSMDQDADGDGIDDLVLAIVGDAMPTIARAWFRGGPHGVDRVERPWTVGE